EAVEGEADGLAAEGAGGPALLEADLGGQVECPQAGRLAEAAGGLVQQGAQVVVVSLGPGGADGPGSAGLGTQAGQAFGLEGVEGVAHGLGRATEGSSDLGGAPSLIAVQEDLAAAQGKGVGGTQPQTKGFAFGVGQRPHEQRWFHASFYAPDTICKECSLRWHWRASRTARTSASASCPASAAAFTNAAADAGQLAVGASARRNQTARLRLNEAEPSPKARAAATGRASFLGHADADDRP